MASRLKRGKQEVQRQQKRGKIMETLTMIATTDEEAATQQAPMNTTEEIERRLLQNAVENISQYDVQIGRTHPLRILLVEDSLVNLKIALWFLKKLGYRADVAFNGVEAIDALERRSYDVILMDDEMPEMSGEEATALIRKNFPHDRQPHIIALTGNAGDDDRARYLAAGMNDHITKPLKVKDLIKALLFCSPLSDINDNAAADDEMEMVRVAC
jgi:CheY-like chemotaxis protein